jgi:hypothetical protein
VIVADDASLAAIGPDPLSVETVPAAVDAGAAQTQREALVWTEQSDRGSCATSLSKWSRGRSTGPTLRRRHRGPGVVAGIVKTTACRST